MPDPTFTVIVPTRDRRELLAEALASVLQQTCTDWECIVVDDAGTDPAGPFDDPRILVVRHEVNRGVAQSRNTGMARARGRYLTFLDDDDRWFPRRLELALQGLERAPVAICHRVGSDGTSGSNRLLEGDVFDRILDALTPHLGQVAVKRELAPAFDPRYVASQDIDWWLRLAGTATVTTVPEVGLWYRKHSGPRHGNTQRARVEAGLLLLEQHADYFAAHPRAAAFRWKRIGLMAAGEGDRPQAWQAFIRSLRLRRDPAVLVHLARLLRPSPAGG